MKTNKILLAAAVMASACAATAETVGVTVDFTRPAGPVKPLHGVNNAPVRPQKGAKVWEFDMSICSDPYVPSL